MACPYCGETEDELEGISDVEDLGYPEVAVIYDAHCNACGKEFKQRYFTRVDDYDYENIKED